MHSKQNRSVLLWRSIGFLILLLTAVEPSLADGPAGDLDAAIEQHRKGLLVIEAPPGTAVVVEQQRHEFWFGAALASQAFDGHMRHEQGRWQAGRLVPVNPMCQLAG
jgi:hypothetical protein